MSKHSFFFQTKSCPGSRSRLLSNAMATTSSALLRLGYQWKSLNFAYCAIITDPEHQSKTFESIEVIYIFSPRWNQKRSKGNPTLTGRNKTSLVMSLCLTYTPCTTLPTVLPWIKMIPKTSSKIPI